MYRKALRSIGSTFALARIESSEPLAIDESAMSSVFHGLKERREVQSKGVHDAVPRNVFVDMASAAHFPSFSD